MGEPWRWVLRTSGVLALVAGGVLLALHPSATFRLVPPKVGIIPARAVGVTSGKCFSPFNRLTDYQLPPQTPPPGIDRQIAQAATAPCSAATNDREHIVEALGIGAIVLVGLSFIPRRRALATTRGDRNRCRSEFAQPARPSDAAQQIRVPFQSPSG